MASWQAFAMRTILRFTMKRAGRNGIDVDKTRASLGAPRPEVLKIWPGWNVGPRVVEGLTFETYDRGWADAARRSRRTLSPRWRLFLAPRIPCAREFMPAFGLGEPVSSILRVGLGPL